jgi:cytochrome c556
LLAKIESGAKRKRSVGGLNRMKGFRSAGIVVGLTMLVGALEARQAPPAKRTAAPPSTVSADATIQEIMATMISPSSKIVFEAVSTVTVKGKEQQKVPTTDAEWGVVRNAALKMVEGSKLITMDGRHVARNLNAKGNEGELSPREVEALLAKNRSTFNKLAREFGDVAGTALKAAEKKDVDGVFASAGDLDAACENCHLTFWYPDQDKLFDQKPTKK